MFSTLDNFPGDTLDSIRGVCIESDFPWHLRSGVSSPGDPGVKFARVLYRDGKEQQSIPEEYRKIVMQFPRWMYDNRMCDDTLSLRFNITMKNNVPDHVPHVDHGSPYAMTALLYCSDTNGGTLFYENPSSAPVAKSEGRFGTVAVFKSNSYHRVEGHTEGESARIILNCVFLPTPEFLAKFEAGEV